MANNDLPTLTKNEKDLLQSRTFWGAIISGIGYGLQHFGIAINDVMWTDTLIMFAGIAITVYGRYKAELPITSVLGLTLKRFADAELAQMRSQHLRTKATPPVTHAETTKDDTNA